MLEGNKLVSIFLVLAFLALSAPVAWAQATECAADRHRYHDLNKPLFYHDQKGDQNGRQRYEKEKKTGSSALTGFVRDLIIRELNRDASAGEITGYLSCIQQSDPAEIPSETPEYFSLQSWDPNATNTPISFSIQVEGGPLNITGLVLNRGAGVIPDTEPIVQCFAKKGTNWALVGTAGEDYERHTFSMYELDSPVPGQAWILLSGKLLGGSGAELKVELIGCDHSHVKTLWKRDHLFGGTVSVENDGRIVVISHLKPGPDGVVPAIHGDVETVTEVLSVTPQGLR